MFCLYVLLLSALVEITAQCVAQPSLTMGTDEPSRVLLQKCVPKRHRWRQPIKFVPVICPYIKTLLAFSMEFFGYAAMRVYM